jgi:hypothetical protein
LKLCREPALIGLNSGIKFGCFQSVGGIAGRVFYVMRSKRECRGNSRGNSHVYLSIYSTEADANSANYSLRLRGMTGGPYDLLKATAIPPR